MLVNLAGFVSINVHWLNSYLLHLLNTDLRKIYPSTNISAVFHITFDLLSFLSKISLHSIMLTPKSVHLSYPWNNILSYKSVSTVFELCLSLRATEILGQTESSVNPKWSPIVCCTIAFVLNITSHWNLSNIVLEVISLVCQVYQGRFFQTRHTYVANFGRHAQKGFRWITCSVPVFSWNIVLHSSPFDSCIMCCTLMACAIQLYFFHFCSRR